MTRMIALAALLLSLTGCVEAMPLHDENNHLLNQSWHADARGPWTPRMLFE